MSSLARYSGIISQIIYQRRLTPGVTCGLGRLIWPAFFSLVFGVTLLSTRAEASMRNEVVTVGRNGADYVATTAPDDSVLSQGSDPAAVINAAITSVSLIGGGTVLIEAGTYDVGSPILGRTGVRLVGAGGLVPNEQKADDYPTVLRAARAGMPAVVEYIGADGARLEHLVIDGAGKADCGLKTASYAVRVRDCAFRGGMARCVWVTAEEAKSHDMYVQATFINCLFDQENKGIGIDESLDMVTRKRPPQGGNMHTGAFTDGVIYGCRFMHVGDIGAELTGGWQFFENTLSGEGRQGGVAVYGGASTITDNDIETTAGPALLIVLGNVAITGNHLVRTGPGSVIKVLHDVPAVTIAENHWRAGNEAGGYFVEFDSSPTLLNDAIFNNMGGEADVCNVPATTSGLYCQDNQAGDDGQWRPAPSVESWQGTDIGAVVSLQGGLCVAQDMTGHTIASSSDAGAVINAAIAAVKDTARAVFVCRGTYSVVTPIRLRKDVVLVGEGGMSHIPVGYEAMGTILKAGAAGLPAVVDMTDAAGSRVDELAVDGSGTAVACVKMAGRAEIVDNCFFERAGKFGVEIVNGNDPAQGAYSGMVAANILVHGGGDPTDLAIRSDSSARGEAPVAGTVIDARLRLGFIQASLGGGSGWTFIGNHGTSNAHSRAGVEIYSDDVTVTGNYFDTAHGPRLVLAGHRLDVVGNHFQATPALNMPTISLAAAGKDIQLLANTWHPPRESTTPTDQSPFYFAQFESAHADNVRMTGNFGEGWGHISNLTDAEQSQIANGNAFVPDIGGYARLDVGK